MRVSIVGQGYVGFPLAVAIASIGYKVIGIDINVSLVAQLNKGKPPFLNQDRPKLSSLLENGLYKASTNIYDAMGSDVIIICVPTPLTQAGLPDLNYLISATKSISKCITLETLVVFESTVAPGTTREILMQLLESESKINKDDLQIAFSPERIDPLNTFWDVINTPKLVAGANKSSLKRAVEFYSQFIEEVVPVDSIEVAEIAKLLENSFRLINVSFVNELAIFCNKYGVEINDVIRAASSKPYGFMPFYPSLGVGGHCIPVDPIYLSDKAKQVGSPLTMIDLANHINKKMPSYFIRRAHEKISGLKGKKILVLGLAYKPNISDTRESPVEPLIKDLRYQGAIVEWHDNLVGEWNGEKSVDLGTNYDLAILATLHDYFDLSKLGNVPILNTRGSL